MPPPPPIEILARITADARYQRNLAWGEPRSGHPEGTIAAHIRELEQNLARLESKLSDDEIARLRILIHVHDTFKPDATDGVPIRDPRSHASLARAFLAEFTDDATLLDIVQNHDEPYALFLRARRGAGPPDPARWTALNAAIRDWDLFVAFALIDGSTRGKGRQPLIWLLTQLKRDGVAPTRFGLDDVAALAPRQDGVTMIDVPKRQLHEENRLSWNAASVAHNSHKLDQAGFFRRGGCKLYPEERDLLGDVRDASIVHLQCNCGQDTLSIANLRARSIIGVDISDTAIEFARQLAADSGISTATFVRSDVYDWLGSVNDQFDIAFSSYGALCWLSDLNAWARGVAGILKRGGRLVLVDYHPASQMFDEQLQRKYPYFADGRVQTWPDGVSDYVAQTGTSPYGAFLPGVRDFKNPHPVHEFQWAIGEIITAILDAGLTLTTLKEFPYANGHAPFKGMRHDGNDRWFVPPDAPSIPLMYAIAARKPV